MKIDRILSVLLAALLWAGCTNDPLTEPGGIPGDGSTVTATFTFTPSLAGEVEVNSRAPISNENLITNLWVVQFSADGKTRLGDPQYITSLTASGGGYQAEAHLTSQSCRVCFVANTGNETLYQSVTSEADMANVQLTVTSEESLATAASGIVMAGVWVGTPNDMMSAGPMAVSLTRAAAKVNLKLTGSLPSGDSYTVSKVTLKQVPGKIFPYRNSTTTPYPVMSSSADVFDYPAITTGVIGAVNTTAKITSWYMPENARGTGTATTQKEKNATTAPSGEGSYCTYIEIEGVYINAMYGTVFPTKYRIYLGANNTSDYSVLRNTNYTLNVTIKGQYILDTRIEMDVTSEASWYTDDINASPWFVVAKTDVTEVDWTTATANCPSGWRLPTQKELMLMHVYNGIIEMVSWFYWTSEDYFDTTMAWCVEGKGGDTRYEGKSAKYHARYVKTVATAGKKYPYAEGNFIVSRDGAGGVKTSALGSVPARFEVAASDAATSNNWATAKNSCPLGWRLPTQEELILMYVTFASKMSNDSYWASTESSSVYARMLSISMGGILLNNDKESGRGCSRCARSVDASTVTYPYLEQGKYIVFDKAAGSYNGLAFHAPWTGATPAHTDKTGNVSAINTVSAKLEVAAANCNGSNAPGVTETVGSYYL